ncbi:MAG: ATP-binding protein [Deltaproteobacteria bacterium]|nr:ATP-binding protein [Deltaproteobacteria bacterium]
MVILSGPRQCGKTTLVSAITARRHGTYLNWDDPAAKRILLQFSLDPTVPLWTFDELHKFRRWRNFLKGLYDTTRPHQTQILVTGSARLELYGRGGDSLQGRYYPHHLHPLTLSELLRRSFPSPDEITALGREVPGHAETTLRDLFEYGGFPEPFGAADSTEAARWRLQYGERLVQEEVRSLEQVQELERLALLYDRLATTIGSPLSLNGLREDLDVAFGTVKKWVEILDRLDAVFRIPPFGPPRIKAIKKEQKLYYWDWRRVEEPSARFENLVAMHLYRCVDWLRDVHGQQVELRYFRTREGHEVDFLLLRGSQPWIAIEVKYSATSLAPGLKYLLERVPVPHGFQVHFQGGEKTKAITVGSATIYCTPATRFLAQLP